MSCRSLGLGIPPIQPEQSSNSVVCSPVRKIRLETSFKSTSKGFSDLLCRLESLVVKKDRIPKVEKVLKDLCNLSDSLFEKGEQLCKHLSPEESLVVETQLKELETKKLDIEQQAKVYLESREDNIESPVQESLKTSCKSTTSTVKRLKEQKLEVLKEKLRLEREFEMEKVRRRVEIKEKEDEVKLLEFEEEISRSEGSLVSSRDKVDNWFQENLKNPTLDEECEVKDVNENNFKTSKKPFRALEPQEKTTQSFQMSQNFNKSLPKWKLATFSGNPLHWPEWKSMFLSTIGSASISNVEKLNYLRSYVCGKAKIAIEGLPFSDAMFDQAWKVLDRKFGMPHIIVTAHLDRINKFPPVRIHNSDQIIDFSLVVSNLVNVLREVRYEHDLFSSSNLQLVVNKLPPNLKEEWTRKVVEANCDAPSLIDFDEWLQGVSQAHERMLATNSVSTSRTIANHVDRRRDQKLTDNFAVKGESNSNSGTKQSLISCPVDKCSQPLWKCQAFKAKSAQERVQVVSNAKACYRCLSFDHFSRNCKFNRKCGVDGCQLNHNSLLHTGCSRYGAQNNRTVQPNLISNSSNAHIAKVDQGLLQVVKVRLYGGTSAVETFALCDSGSTHTWIDSNLANILNLKSKSQSLIVNSFQAQSTFDTSKVECMIGPCSDNLDFPVKLTAFTRNEFKLGSDVVDVKSFKRRWSHLEDIELDEIDFRTVKVLLGQNVFSLICPLEYKSKDNESPWAVRTQLGWVLSGPIPRNGPNACASLFAKTEDELTSQVKQWWDLESFSSQFSVDPRSEEDKRALNILESSAYHTGERYSVGLLWSEDEKRLENNFAVAYSQLMSVERRLSKDNELKEMYAVTVQKDIENGYVEIVKDSEIKRDDLQWYLPHHPVLNPNKPGKVRRVCNAASKFRGVSLNDALLVGPDLLNNLIGVLLRFRQDKVGVSADIEAMFMQVEVPRKDQSFLRFLWREDPSKKVEVFQYTRHIFGAKDSPTAANFVLRKTATDNVAQFPDAAKSVLSNFYMDDLLKSVSSEEQAITSSVQLFELLKLGGFKLAKWVSNIPAVHSNLPNVEGLAPESLVVLGLQWNLIEDSFNVCRGLDKIIPETVTQRFVLSSVSSIFDPLGIVVPFTLKARLLFKLLWQKHGSSWDEPLQENDSNVFKEWFSEVKQLSKARIDRCYVSTNISSEIKSRQLHVFGDASLSAICAVAYLRSEFQDGSFKISFVLGKTRVAPMKPLTIPKLELQAAVLATKIASAVLSELEIPFQQVVMWSDSTTVIQWLRSSHKKHQVFVSNRIVEILSSTSVDQWRHLPGEVNPADCGTRGLSCEELLKSIWLKGPEFLNKHEQDWPQNFPQVSIENIVDDYEAKAHVLKVNDSLVDFSRFSQFKRLLHSLVYVRRFMSKMKKQDVETFISVEELSNAKLLIWQEVQKDCFPLELQELQKERSCLPSSSIAPLSPFLGTDNLIRSKGRLRKGNLPFSMKHPVILHAKHKAVELFLTELHNEYHHEGVEYLRSVVQKEFWIVKLRSALRAIKHKCNFCRLRSKEVFQPEMADLPSFRLSMTYPFVNVGIDCFGPFEVKLFRRTLKRWGCLFSCLTTRAVHIEVLESLDISSCVTAIERFISRRGKPNLIVSDNGTNFVGAAKEVRALFREAHMDSIFRSKLSSLEIKWIFNPPSAPHFGGVWERMIRSCKRSMLAVLGGRRLTDEVLRTVLCLVEQTLNCRPLTAVSSDVEDLEALTPFHFLIGRPGVALPSNFVNIEDPNFRKIYKNSEAYANLIWKRFMNELCPSFNVRSKWRECEDRSLQIGDLVWILDTNTFRDNYKLGRIVEVIPGDDGTVRVAKVKTASGSYTRPIVKLVPLPQNS